MKHKALMIAAALATAGATQAQQPLTPEMLWQLGRVSAEAIMPDGKDVVFGVTYYDLAENKAEKNLFRIPVSGGTAQQLTSGEGTESVVHTDRQSGAIIYLHNGQLWQLQLGDADPKQLTDHQAPLQNVRFSPDSKHILFTKAVPLKKMHSTDRHADLPKSDAYVYDALDYRHWDTWADGTYSHVFYAT